MSTSAAPRTLAEKIWESHVVYAGEDGRDLLYVDLHLIHEVTSPQAFAGLIHDGGAMSETYNAQGVQVGQLAYRILGNVHAWCEHSNWTNEPASLVAHGVAHDQYSLLRLMKGDLSRCMARHMDDSEALRQALLLLRHHLPHVGEDFF